VNSDFEDAHKRHWEDAEMLYDNDRWANADHLYGMAAECGLKCLMLVFGMPFDHTRDMPRNRPDRQHADGIWARYESYRYGHTKGTHYALSTANPFHDWDVSQRYANRSNFDQARAQSHQAGAKAVRRLVERARREGFI